MTDIATDIVTDIVLRPAHPGAGPCKVCGAPALPFGEADFNRSCMEPRAATLPPLGIAVPFRRCTACGFLFTECFDDWTAADFKRAIYNDDYIRLDPDYAERRPRENASMVIRHLYEDRARLRVLDYGGGTGLLARYLRDAGFACAETFEPFNPQYARRPDGPFDVVTCFETLEHLTDPLAGIADMTGLLSPAGVVLFSTLLQPADFDRLGMAWWYVGPRNGHVSLFSAAALAAAWRRHGFRVASFSEAMHVAFRDA
jgi:SAM-dependent methyltransferase